MTPIETALRIVQTCDSPTDLIERIARELKASIAVEREACAKMCDEERSEYQKSMEEFDRRGDTTMGTNEARYAATAQRLAELIRARK